MSYPTTPYPVPPQGDTARVVTRVERPQPVKQAIASAAQQTSVDFDYLLAQAEVESAMNPTAKARTSSATGLFQFIESTWLGTMQRHGNRFGLGNLASQISTSRNGQAYVADSGQRQAILALRNDPQVASLMAAGLAEDNRAHLTPILGRQPDHGELYLAHFLGAGGAGRFLSLLAQDPNQSAAALFRKPAAANRSIFYEPGGAPRSLAGVMEVIDGKMQRALARAGHGAIEGLPDGMPAGIAPALSTPMPYTPLGTAPGIVASRTRPVTSGSVGLPPALSSGPSSPRPPMSSVLSATFGENGLASLSSPEGSAQVRRAYEQLKALGL
ncbi:MAG: transglycosylase SLT domain-containing protein [Pseudomonadota bacterium]